uniref:Uncharacterized protein n=3 Tax=unclassified Caudoviricetes TaxID=2788787 RepID=A0AAU8GGA5_9CAUD
MDMQLDNAYIQGMNMPKHRKTESQDLRHQLLYGME